MMFSLRGRATPVLDGPCPHALVGDDVTSTPAGTREAFFAMGCFWGAEKLYWLTDGVALTAVGYLGGQTPNPTYEEVCTGATGHAETVRVCYDPAKTTYEDLLKLFFENHDPTQGMRQGADRGSQYRSAIYYTDDAQRAAAEAARDAFQAQLSKSGYGEITTEIAPAGEFYYAEAYHQQYLRKNPGGYCPVHATGVTLPQISFPVALMGDE